MRINFQNLLSLIFATICLVNFESHAEPSTTITVHSDAPSLEISRDLFGIFFEDINYAADGGLYAELVQNRSFEYSGTDGNGWTALTGWKLIQLGGSKGALSVETDKPLNGNNPHYAMLKMGQPGSSIGLANSGFDGIAIKKGERYQVSFFARQTSGNLRSLRVCLEGPNGAVEGEALFSGLTAHWAKYCATIDATVDETNACLVLLVEGSGTICFDTVSLFPQKTFHNRPNGLRDDLAQSIADLHPKFMRFPGGCLVHGQGLGNIYRWKDTIGPIEQRKEQRNLWGYHQSVGLGYFEYFQFCEDIGAKPLPVQAAGVCCQNSFGGQHGVPMEQMKEVVQDILDLIEYANGPTNSIWGAKRAAAGHPGSFHLQYIGVGNEDEQTPAFGIRFKMIYDAVKAKHPEIEIIGTVGPASSGQDYVEGWKFADELGVDMVDEHYYERPEWFLGNLHRYDNYTRKKTRVYLGEYASWGNTLDNAIVEAAYLTTLERNGDVVRMASYAPLLGRENHMQWKPDLIYFNNSAVCPSANYYVQQLFSQNQGDQYVPTEVSPPSDGIRKVGILLGTWDTQAEFKNVKVVSDDKTLVDEPLTEVATNWSAESGEWQILNGSYVQSANGQPAISRLNTGMAASDYTLTLKARKMAGREGFLIGFAAQDSANYYWWNIGGWENSRNAIEKTAKSSKVVVGEPCEGHVELNHWYDIKVVVSHGRIECYLDGKLAQKVADNSAGISEAVLASTVKDSKTGDLIIKLVNVTGKSVPSTVILPKSEKIEPTGIRTVLTGNPSAENDFENPKTIFPVTSKLSVANSFTIDLASHSLVIVRIKPQRL